MVAVTMQAMWTAAPLCASLRAMQPAPYSYRHDPGVPSFDDEHALVVFDGECVLCSRSMRLLVRLDRAGRFRLTPAQGVLGQALYRYAGLPTDSFETYLVVIDGFILTKSDAIIAIAQALPWPGRAAVSLRIAPRRLRDGAYSWVARRRYGLFGRTKLCGLLNAEMQDRLL
jgi:predicted DCC family thiol-disulfide oxidoreductase YuxK